MTDHRYRDASTGQYVDEAYAKLNPATTVREEVADAPKVEVNYMECPDETLMNGVQIKVDGSIVYETTMEAAMDEHYFAVADAVEALLYALKVKFDSDESGQWPDGGPSTWQTDED